jgi:2-iminobutanoate/2-iminopropanoate deaminase
MLKKMSILLIIFIFLSCHSDKDEVITKTIIKSSAAPKAIGPYSQAVKIGDALYCSGQIAIDPKTGELVNDSIESETEQVLKNLGAVLNEAGMDYSDVVLATVFMSDIENYGKINSVYAKYFAENPPARAAVQVVNLPKYVRVEISCIAVKEN